MILSFKEVGIDCFDYNGQTYTQAHAEIINKVCDYLMLYYFYGRKEEECIPDPNGAFVNFILRIIVIDTAIPTQH